MELLTYVVGLMRGILNFIALMKIYCTLDSVNVVDRIQNNVWLFMKSLIVILKQLS